MVITVDRMNFLHIQATFDDKPQVCPSVPETALKQRWRGSPLFTYFIYLILVPPLIYTERHYTKIIFCLTFFYIKYVPVKLHKYVGCGERFANGIQCMEQGWWKPITHKAKKSKKKNSSHHGALEPTPPRYLRLPPAPETHQSLPLQCQNWRLTLSHTVSLFIIVTVSVSYRRQIRACTVLFITQQSSL